MTTSVVSSLPLRWCATPVMVLGLLVGLPVPEAAAQGGDDLDLGPPERRTLSRELRRESMADALSDYFGGEERGGWIFAGVGAASLVVGGTLLSQEEPGRSAAYPMLGLGAAQVAVGAILIARTPAQVERLRLQMEQQPDLFREEELRRMKRVLLTFKILEGTEIGLIAAGIGMAAGGAAAGRSYRPLEGVGIGLSIQAAAILVQDILAERRAKRYVRALESFRVGPIVRPEERVFGLQVRRRF